jgi:hypothetical protein
MTFTTLLMSDDGESAIDVQLPFAPFPGLYLRDPLTNNDFRQVTRVFWLEEPERFEVFFS